MMPAENAWMEKTAELLDPTPSPYRGKPITWVKNKLSEHLTSDQRKIMRSVVKNRYTAVKSAHDTGKSFDVSRLIGWWIDSHPIGEAFVVSTAPTAAQVGAIVWREVGRMHRKGKLPGRVTGNNEWKIGYGTPGKKLKGTDDHDEFGSELVAYGRKPADYDPGAFSGIHARYVLVVIDEACGVPKSIFDAADTLATNRHARVVAIGNPDDPNSHFATVCKPGSGWNVIRIDGLTTVGFSEERVLPYPKLYEYMIQNKIPFTKEWAPEELYDLLLDPEWAEERIKRWGPQSPMFTSKVRGEFPIVSIDSLIHPHLVTLAQAREARIIPTMARIGADVARYGRDHTIIILRQGGHARVVVDIPYGPVTETAGEIQRVGSELGVALPVACVDDVGVGGGVVDILEENGYPVAPITGSSASIQLQKNGKARFNNRRSELFWNLREALAGPSGTGEDGWLDLDPEDDELAAQLTNIKYKVNSQGQICVEQKEDMIARHLPSPDRADALCYSVAPDEPRIRGGHIRQDAMITGDLLNMRW